MQNGTAAGIAAQDVGAADGAESGTPLGRPAAATARAADFLRRVPLRVAAAAGALLIALIGGIGAIDALAGPLVELEVFGRNTGSPFALDGEWNLPALWSGVLLAFGACAALLLRDSAHGRLRMAAAGLALAFAYMALDEVFILHERFQSITGVNWQLLMVPVGLVAGAAWCGAVIELRRVRRVVGLLVAGAAAWLGAQALEAIAWKPDLGYHRGSSGQIVAEELLEMSGSLMLALGLLAAAQHLWARRRAL